MQTNRQRWSVSIPLGAILLALGGCGDGSAAIDPPPPFAQTREAFPMAPDCSRGTGDGEGCAVIDVEELVAGSKSEYTIEVEAGPSGIAPGGSVVIGVHHAWTSPQQTRFPGSKNFVDVRTETGVPVRTSESSFGREITPPQADAMYHNVLRATLPKGLEAGKRIRFRYGANAQDFDIFPNRDFDHEFRVLTDIDGDGTFRAIGSSPVIDIVPDVADAISASVPAQAVTGTPVRMILRIEDPHINVATDWSGTVTVRNEKGEVIVTDLPVTEGMAVTDISFTDPGPQRLRLESADGTLVGRSNPMMVFEEMPERRLYWTELHGHTHFSDGLGDGPDEYFAFGRDVAGLDAIALTDHGFGYDWSVLTDAVGRYNVPGEYVTILGLEAGAGPNHQNVYFRAGDQNHFKFWPKGPFATDDFVEKVANQYLPKGDREAMMGAHHSSYERGPANDPDYPFGVWDDRVIRFFEVYSSHGTSEHVGNSRPVANPSRDPSKYMQYGLAQGLRFAVIGASDNHDSRPGRSSWGRYPGGLAGVWATDLDREAIWDAIWNRHVYATSLDRIYMTFGIGEAFMGDEITLGAPARLTGTIVGKEDTLKLEVLRDNETIHTIETGNGVIELDWTDDTPAGEHYYYLRVTEENGERAWSSPIWVTRTG